MIILSIFLAYWFGLLFKENWVLSLSLILIFIIFLFFRFRDNRKLIIFIFLICLLGILVSYISFDTSKNNYLGIISKTGNNYFILNTGIEKMYVPCNDHQYQIGDVVRISGFKYKYDFAVLESEFDFNKYLSSNGIKSAFNANKIDTIFAFPLRISKIKANFLNKYNEDTRNYIGSLFFGNGYDNPLSINLKELHLYRSSTLTGFFVALLIKALRKLLILKFSDKTSDILSLALLSPYILLTITKFSIWKLLVLYLIRLIDKYCLDGKISYINSLSGFGILCLIFNKNLAIQSSFILSFSMSYFFYFYMGSFSRFKGIKKKLISMLFAYLILIPFETINYHEISLLGPVVQLLVSPLIVVIHFAITCSFFTTINLGVANAMIEFLECIVGFIKPIMLTVYCAPMKPMFILLYEAILLGIIYIFSISYKPLFKISISIFSLFSIYLVPFQEFSLYYVAFLNIGQGDSTFIHYKDLNILVDTGGSLYKDIAKECLIPFFKKQKIYALDYLITTHDDFDHIGAKDSLMENFKVKKYLNTNEQFPLIYKDFRMENLNIYSEDDPDENRNSLVLKFSIKNTSFLIMGDAPKDIENFIIRDHPDLRCDILKVGHHGSNTSSGYNFVKTVDPDTAIISCGKRNKYGHPHKEVINVLNRLDIDIRRTDFESTIYYYF